MYAKSHVLLLLPHVLLPPHDITQNKYHTYYRLFVIASKLSSMYAAETTMEGGFDCSSTGVKPRYKVAPTNKPKAEPIQPNPSLACTAFLHAPRRPRGALLTYLFVHVPEETIDLAGQSLVLRSVLGVPCCQAPTRLFAYALRNISTIIVRFFAFPGEDVFVRERVPFREISKIVWRGS